MKKSTYFFAFGSIFLSAAIVLAASNFVCEYRAQKTTIHVSAQLEQKFAEAKENGDISSEIPAQTTENTDYLGILTIPALDLTVPINNTFSEANLKLTPCRYAGSLGKNDLVICGHNYAAHFRDLKSLKKGDALYFTDINGNTHSFTLSTQEILAPIDNAAMIDSDYDLTLFTCTKDGQKRLVLRFVQQ